MLPFILSVSEKGESFTVRGRYQRKKTRVKKRSRLGGGSLMWGLPKSGSREGPGSRAR